MENIIWKEPKGLGINGVEKDDVCVNEIWEAEKEGIRS